MRNEKRSSGIGNSWTWLSTACAALVLFAGVRSARPEAPSGIEAARLAAPGNTSWPSFRNDPQQTGVAGSTLPETLEVLWKHPAADGVVAACAIVGDRVYVPELSGNLACLERKTGRPVWTYRSVADPDEFAPGFKATPTVTGDSVYVGDEDGVLHALDLETGKKRWAFASNGEIAGSAAVVGNRVIFGSHDSFLYCLKAVDGSLVWMLQTDDRINCSTGIVENFTFVTGCDGHLRVIDIDTGKQQRDIDLGSYIIASPAIVGDVLYVGNHEGELMAVNWKQGRGMWREKPPRGDFPYHASAAVTDKFVIVGSHDKQVHCFERETGDRRWSFRTMARVNSSAAIVGDRVFVGSDDGHVYEIGLEDGRERWKLKAGRRVSAGMAVGEGVLVFGTDEADGFAYCLGAKP